MVDVAQLEER